MPTMGEYLVGAYVQLIEGCDVLDYGVRLPGGGQAGLNELDVMGLNFKTNTAFLCEVTTHILGMLYKDNRTTVERIAKKHENQRSYAQEYLKNFHHFRYMLWSPRVPRGYITEHLTEIEGLELVINGAYGQRIAELQALAARTTHDTGNSAFRMLQILGHMRE